MSVTIRRKDSVTSIILFLFNVFLLPQGRESIALGRLLDLASVFGKSESAVRMALSRAVENDLLLKTAGDTGIVYSLTQRGKRHLDNWWETMRRYQQRAEMQKTEWNGQWYYISLFVPEEKSESREELLQLISSLGFGNLNRGLWISPYDFMSVVDEKANELGLGKHVLLVKGQFIGKHDVEQITKRVWNLDGLKEKYLELSSRLERVVSLDSREPKYVLPLLHTLGMEIMSLMSVDPALPSELLQEDWPGGECLGMFLRLRDQLLPKAQAYVNSII